MAHRPRKNAKPENTQFRTQHHQKKNNNRYQSGDLSVAQSGTSNRYNKQTTHGTRAPSTSYVPSSTTTNFFDLLDDDIDPSSPSSVLADASASSSQKSGQTNTPPTNQTKKQNASGKSSTSNKISSVQNRTSNHTNDQYSSVFGGLFLEYHSNGDDEWNTEIEKYNKLLDEKCAEKHIKPIFSQDHNEPVYISLNKIEPMIDPTLINLPHRVAFVRAISSDTDEAEVIRIIHNVLEFWTFFNTLATKNLQFLSPLDPAKAKQANDIFHSLFENNVSQPVNTSHTTRKQVKDNPKFNELRRYNELHLVYAFIKLDYKVPDSITTIKIPYIRENGNGKALNDVNINLGSSKAIASRGIHIFNPDSYGGLLPNIISDFVCESMFDMSRSPHIINDGKITAITLIKSITVKYDAFYNGLRLRILISNTLEQKVYANEFEPTCLSKYISMDGVEYNKLVCNITPKN